MSSLSPLSIMAVDIWAQWDLIALLCVSRFAFLLQSHIGLSIKEIGDIELEI